MSRITIQTTGLATGYLGKRSRSVVTANINAELHSGELTCLLGPNGAGKSTLLRTLSAFLPPLEGDILIKGKSVKEYSAAELAKVIGVVLTERIRLNNMTVLELVGMGRSPYTGFWGRLSAEDNAKVREAIDMVGIRSLAGRVIQTLSDGERQKVMIAKALAQETPIIFLDEPTAFLDYPSKVEILHLLKDFSRECNKTIFLSTHDLELALQIADRIWLVEKGRGLKIGTPEDLSISGDMSSYFERKGVVFDIDMGLFRIEPPKLYPVRIAEGVAHRGLVVKALARNGYYEESGNGDASLVEAAEGGYRLNGKLCRTIAELLDNIGKR